MQMVMGTLMNLCDHPTSVSVGAEEWREDRELRRVPIIITGNDLSTLYAPLLRDGRMDKFMWAPSIDERAAAVHAVMADAGVTARDALELVRAFSNQARSVTALVPTRPRRRGERRSSRTSLPGVSLLPPPLAFNPETP